MELKFILNGKPIVVADVPAEETLLNLLRARLGMLGTKEGCGVGECGACTVLLDGSPINSCLTPAGKASGREVTTIEGLGSEDRPHPVQEAFVEAGAVQCGFCTPGMIMSTHALLQENPDPDDERIKTALAGNLCRCTGYRDILKAVKLAAKRSGGKQ